MDPQTQINELRQQLALLDRSSLIPRDVEMAFRQRLLNGTVFNLNGILYGNGASAITSITPLVGTKIYYVSDSSGGTVNRKLTFTNGILTAET